MTDPDWQNVKEIFLAALEKDEPDRAAYLDSVCNGNRETRAKVESLLKSHTAAEDFIETPAFSTSQVFENDNGRIDQRFGAYTIEREIGHGGMGAVFLARRNDGEFDQMVALKIVRQSIAESHVIERFKNERQILASLNHPNISRLLDGGVSENREPFLAMEYIEGEQITDFAKNQNLSVNDKLRLFLKVCAAVAYAHRNLVVHRDIKPANILVTADGEPKLLDFGLAKLSEPPALAGGTDQTQTAFRALTPAYASPEQLKGQPITTSSDVYSLGIVLFELLTGERPFHFEGMTIDEIIRTITSSEPALPSRTAASTSQLKGDLDNIILTALRNEPERRYKSVEAFATDIERHLKGLPVSARPNTVKYRSGKFIKRHKVGVFAASLILLSLIAGIVVSLWQVRVARREKAKAEAVNSFMQTMLGASSPDSTLRVSGRDLTVKDVLDDASKRLATEDLSSQPEVKAELQRIIGKNYVAIGQYDLGEQNLNAALEAQTRIYGKNDLETLKTLVDMGSLWVNKGNFATADTFYRQSIPNLRSEQKKGTISADYLSQALGDFALLRRTQGDSKEAETLLREAIALSPQMSPDSKIFLSIEEGVLALTLADQGKLDEAVEILRKKVESIRAEGSADSSDLGTNLTGLGRFLMEQGKFEEAEENLKGGEAIYRKIFNQSNLQLGDNLRLQAQTLYSENQYAEAENKINETLQIYRAGTSKEYVNYPTALTVQGLIYNATNRTAEAEKILREAVQIRTASLPREHYLSAFSISALGECLMTQKRFAEAEPLLVESYESLKTSQGEQNPRTLLAKSRLDKLHESMNRTAANSK